jgi:hypothetical protein
VTAVSQLVRRDSSQPSAHVPTVSGLELATCNVSRKV